MDVFPHGRQSAICSFSPECDGVPPRFEWNSCLAAAMESTPLLGTPDVVLGLLVIPVFYGALPDREHGNPSDGGSHPTVCPDIPTEISAVLLLDGRGTNSPVHRVHVPRCTENGPRCPTPTVVFSLLCISLDRLGLTFVLLAHEHRRKNMDIFSGAFLRPHVDHSADRFLAGVYFIVV